MANKSSLVSIVMPVYNTGKYLKEAIDSVVAQTFTNWELILVDDGSSDQSGAICDEYAKLDRRICVVHKENQGVSCARNTGIELAKGEWLYFIDSDDCIEDNLLEMLLQYSDGVDLVVCSHTIMSTGRIDRVTEKICYYASFEQSVQKIDEQCIGAFYNYIWNKLYKKEKVTMRFDRHLSLGEDMSFNYQYMKSCTGICAIPNALYRYRWSSEETTLTKKIRPDIMEILKIICETRLKYMGDSNKVRAYVSKEFARGVTRQCKLLAANQNYTLKEKWAIIKCWEENDLWNHPMLDMRVLTWKRWLLMTLMKERHTWAVFIFCWFFHAIEK